MSWGATVSQAKSGKDSFDRRDFLLNVGLLMAAISFLTAFVGLKIGGIRIAYKYYQYVYLYVILLSSLRYGMIAGMTTSLALGFLTITASEVLPQFREMQDIPTSPNVQLVLYVFFAYLAAYSMERDKLEQEELHREIELLRNENQSLSLSVGSDDMSLPEVYNGTPKTRPSRTGGRTTTRKATDNSGGRAGRKIELDRDSSNAVVSENSVQADTESTVEEKPRVIRMRSRLMSPKGDESPVEDGLSGDSRSLADSENHTSETTETAETANGVDEANAARIGNSSGGVRPGRSVKPTRPRVEKDAETATSPGVSTRRDASSAVDDGFFSDDDF
ncbi:MAG: hypothetical protein CVV64_08750 [Candidatus Wallbacteria bacterium HGW-Wallbacteria-1]|jgi:hypothetical protein|uniref:Uncharacterized protein n=1 Tax=Candidatus Wallbacteria bacterium HGW-Wallbacteria-1 TaxID=2013854 RepID=A0A2N1PQ38_9BACT|nr:MAG: hypothetical protein CVV64_08750 [Candidatus Wallbacteria bacterium HGW-Wallbacteria-1]